MMVIETQYFRIMAGALADGLLICHEIRQKLADDILIECLAATQGEGLFKFQQNYAFGSPRPRREAYLSEGNDHSYRYSGKILQSQQPPSSISEFIREYCIRTNETSTNGGVLVNEYPGEALAMMKYGTHSSVGAHSDDEHKVYLTNTIFSLSVGAPRVFRYRRLGKDTRGKSFPWDEIMTTHGMLISMLPGFQEAFEHAVPKPLKRHGRLYDIERQNARTTVRNTHRYRYNLTVRPECIPCVTAQRGACPRVRTKRGPNDLPKHNKAPKKTKGHPLI